MRPSLAIAAAVALLAVGTLGRALWPRPPKEAPAARPTPPLEIPIATSSNGLAAGFALSANRLRPGVPVDLWIALANVGDRALTIDGSPCSHVFGFRATDAKGSALALALGLSPHSTTPLRPARLEPGERCVLHFRVGRDDGRDVRTVRIGTPSRCCHWWLQKPPARIVIEFEYEGRSVGAPYGIDWLGHLSLDIPLSTR